MKTCRRCKELKPVTAFAKCRGRKDGLYSYCRACGSVTNREHQLSIPLARKKRRDFARNIKTNYGLETEDFEQLRMNQQDRCAICFEGFVKTPSVDHCHKTGKIRGLLCQGCNHMLGHAHDSPSRLLAAAAYLRGSK